MSEQSHIAKVAEHHDVFVVFDQFRNVLFDKLLDGNVGQSRIHGFEVLKRTNVQCFAYDWRDRQLKSEIYSKLPEKSDFIYGGFVQTFASKQDMVKMGKEKLMLLLLLVIGLQSLHASPRVLNLDSCRELAVENNKALSEAEAQKQSAYYNRKSAFTNYLPKVSATGIYMHIGKELSLLSDEQKTTLSGIGTSLSMPELNAVGAGLVDALRTDTRNMSGAAVMLTQPIYMGGKIRAYNKIAKYAEAIASDKYALQYQELIVAVDETYWNIVALSARKRLAESYRNLVGTLDSDVAQLIDVGFATKADGLSVKVKVNEANVAIIQVNNGIEILKMKLCQLCGLSLDTPITLADENMESVGAHEWVADEYDDSWENRPELSALGSAVKIHEEKKKIARAEFLPNVVLTGGYFASNPSVFNSFEKKFKGTWNVSVAVNIPLLTWGDRSYKEKAARAEAATVKFEFEETKEKVELQVSQCRQRVVEAREKYAAAMSSQAEADENLRYANLGLKEGVIPVSNVIEAQTAWLSARTLLITSDIDMRLANVYLRKSLGIIK